MKKTKLWKRIAGWLLVFLLVLQLPVNAFAEDWNANEAYTSEETDLAGQDILEEDISADEQLDSEEGTLSDDSVDLVEEDSDDIQATENGDSDPDLDMEEQDTGEGEFTDESAALFSDGTDQSEGETGAAKEIQVTVSVSKDGKFLDDKDGQLMAGRTVTLSGQSSYTMDDALRIAHDLYYSGGAAAGYDFREDESGSYDGLIYKLWGYDRDSVPGIRFALNNDSANYQESLTRSVEDGDSLHFYIQQRKGKDRFAFFTETEETVTQGETITLRLRQSNVYGTAFSDCSGASVYIDGVKQEGLLTDSEGRVTLPALEARDVPYFVTAEKLVETEDGSPATAISAAYANVTVVPASGQTGDYLDAVSLKITDGETQKEYRLDGLNSESAFMLPMELSHGQMALHVDTKDSFPENGSVYAVYTNPADETICRVKLDKNDFSLLRGTSVKYSYKAIQTIRLEVRQEGSVVQSVQIPVSYKTHLTELTLEDSWGHKLGGDLKDTLDDQQMEVLVPQNTKYININAWAPGWAYLSNYPELLSLDGAELTQSTFGLRFTPDWDQHSEYKLCIHLPESEEKYIAEATDYTIIFKKGETDYTPVLSYQGQEPDRYGFMQDEEADPFIIQPEVLREDEGRLSYQWYQGNTSDQMEEIEGAVASSYQVPTDTPHYYNYYKCIVSYEIDGKTYSAESGLYRVRVYPLTLEAPQITKQPADITGVKGVPLQDNYL